MSRKVQVKSRAPAPIQITAEQILREANDRVVKEEKAPRVHITDPEELMQVRRAGVAVAWRGLWWWRLGGWKRATLSLSRARCRRPFHRSPAHPDSTHPPLPNSTASRGGRSSRTRSGGSGCTSATS